jgi:hypothetical protein
MVDALDEASHQSADPPEDIELNVCHRQSLGKVGRPKVTIDPMFLSFALELRGPHHLSKVLGCHPRTVRRRALELGMASAGTPVYRDITGPDGSSSRIWTSTTSPVTAFSDDELDREVTAVLEIFPQFGRRMICGYLRSKGYRVPITRISASYLRVHGTPPAFGPRQIERRIYSVPGVNSLWHHDGQHGELFMYSSNC